MVASTAVFVSCRRNYDQELKLTKQLIAAQSKPVSVEQMLEAERAHVAKLAAQDPSASPSQESSN